MYGAVDGLISNVDKVSQPNGDSPGNISTTAYTMFPFEFGFIRLCCKLSRVQLREFRVHKHPDDTSSEIARWSGNEGVVVSKYFNEDGTRKGAGCTNNLIAHYLGQQLRRENMVDRRARTVYHCIHLLQLPYVTADNISGYDSPD